MTELAAFAAGLFGMLVLAGLTAGWHPKERWQIIRCAVVIFAVWLAGVGYLHGTGDYDPWKFNIVIDALAAWAVMYHPAGKVQGYIGLFYLSQLACHIAYGLREWLGYPNDQVFYYDAITWIAWAQLAAMGVWCGGIWVGDIVHRLRDRRDAADRRASAGTHRKRR